MKKTLLFLLLLPVAVIIFGGCQDKKTDTVPETTAPVNNDTNVPMVSTAPADGEVMEEEKASDSCLNKCINTECVVAKKDENCNACLEKNKSGSSDATCNAVCKEVNECTDKCVEQCGGVDQLIKQSGTVKKK